MPEQLATELQIRSRISELRAALDLRGHLRPNVWAFYSNKNRALLIILGDVGFIQAVLLEGDPDVATYEIGGDFLATKANEEPEGARELHVRYRDGTTLWLQCGRYRTLIECPSSSQQARVQARSKEARECGASFELRTERDFAGRMVEFSNWLILCSAMTRARNFSCSREANALKEAIRARGQILVKDALQLPECDPALIIRALAIGIARGQLHCDLVKSDLTINTTISQRQESDHPSPVASTQSPQPQSRLPLQSMPKTRRTARIPEIWRDLSKWPAPVTDAIKSEARYANREKAVRMYLDGVSAQSLKFETGLSVRWVRKELYRCLKLTTDGRIFGFRALVPNLHVKPYTRQLELPGTNLERARKGFSGAFKYLLAQIPQSLEIIESGVLKVRQKKNCGSTENHPSRMRVRAQNPTTISESRISWVEVHQQWLDLLRRLGWPVTGYPFTTADQGYNSLAKLARSLLYDRPIPWLKARSGLNAAALAETGSGIPPLVLPRGPFQVVEMDFHKHDTAAIIEIKTPLDDVIDAAVPRWWIGCLVDTLNQAILGSADSFEAQTTENCVLDVLDSAISPPEAIDEIRKHQVSQDGCWLPNQTIPGLAYHGWDVLKLDRAWAHKGANVISTMMASVGCAICFGRSKEWWARVLVERTFGSLTREGVQRLPSTFGSGPSDSRRNNPQGQAARYRIRQDEICNLTKSNVRWSNEFAKEGVFFCAPLENLENAILGKSAPYFPRPLPRQFHEDLPVKWIALRTKVEGDPKRGLAPCVRVKGCRFRGVELSEAWSLVGTGVLLQISRRDIRVSRVVLETTGEVLCSVLPDRRWLTQPTSWRNFAMIQKFGREKRRNTRPPSPTTEFLEQKSQELADLAKKGKKLDKRAVQRYANVRRSSLDSAEGTTTPDSPLDDSFALDISETLPEVFPVIKPFSS